MSWPAWATAPIAIADPDPGWAARGAALVAELERALAPWLAAGVHHVGSTAIPDLPAKPILDIMAGVASFDEVPAIAGALAPNGWHLVPAELDARSWRRFLVQAEGDRRIAHLHLVSPDHPRWSAQLRFRDRLRQSSKLRAEYAALKRELALRYRDDREAYSDAKADFVARVVK